MSSLKRRKSQLNIPTIPDSALFTMAFWHNNHIVTFKIPHDVDKVKARRMLQELLDRQNSCKFNLKVKEEEEA